jgi:hypothetical protein
MQNILGTIKKISGAMATSCLGFEHAWVTEIHSHVVCYVHFTSVHNLPQFLGRHASHWIF